MKLNERINLGIRLTCKNSTPWEIEARLDGISEYFSRAEYETAMAEAKQRQVRVPTLDTLRANGFIFPVASETYWIQNEYGEAVECFRYYYRFR